jgi:hypothetical protein
MQEITAEVRNGILEEWNIGIMGLKTRTKAFPASKTTIFHHSTIPSFQV